VIDWYGVDPVWRILFERDAKRAYRDRLRVVMRADRLVFTLVDVEVPGDRERHELQAGFYRHPPYETYGQRPEDAPLVTACPDRPSKHRFANGALCLWHPHDLPERRWTSDHGLRSLLELATRHLFLELHWAATGGPNGGVWLLEDAPHGLGDRK
jgi:hypothetical protein